MIQYLIVDDEPIAHRIIEGYAKNLPHLEKKGNCYNAFDAIQFLQKEKVDVIFLDINMPKLTGFDFLKTLSYPPKIIVTTAYQEFAVEGYELNVLDYLLKPFSFERFVKAVNKISPPVTQSNPVVAVETVQDERIFLKGDKKHHQVLLGDILYVEACGNYTKVVLANQNIMTHATIRSYESLLPSNQFLRIHKSYIVSIPKIETIEGNRIKIGTHQLPIGQTYKRSVNGLLE